MRNMVEKKVLLLNETYETLSFINERRALKLLFKGKVDVLPVWNDDVVLISGKIKLPAILRLRKRVRRNYIANNGFSRTALIRRDDNCCQYCQKRLTPNQLTIDHIIPKQRGGQTSFTNCVVCCKKCNSEKGNKTPEEVEMKLIRKPVAPTFSSYYFVSCEQEFWHPDWNDYLGLNINKKV
jgi:5-methylcytosine-specific restriction endonuclease McrA